MDEIRLHTAVITTWWLRWMGTVMGMGTTPVHSKLYWRCNDQCFMTELTADPAIADAIVVGKGDGYEIQITKVKNLEGDVVAGDASQIEKYARSYASIEKGDLTSSPFSREWYSTPQGYGGPLYDRCTSNTYASWILKKVCRQLPPKPKGALGWDQSPLFPGPCKD